MTTKTFTLSLVAALLLFGAAGVGIYYLRQRNIEGLDQTPIASGGTPTPGSGGSLPGQQTPPTGTATSSAPGVPADGGLDPSRIEGFRSAQSQYTESEGQALSENARAEATLPNDLTQTWTPEFRKQMEAAQNAPRK